MNIISKIILEWVCPIGGTILANLMFYAPVHSAREALHKKHSLGPLNPTPWVLMAGNCCGWVAYGILIKDIYPVIANFPGFLISLYLNLTAVQLLYHDKLLKLTKSINNPAVSSRRNKWLSHDLLFLYIMTLWGVLLCCITFIGDGISQTTKEMVVGLTVNFNLVFFYGGPLSVIGSVIKEKSSVRIHRRTLIMNTVNGAFWTAYAISIVDFYIMIPNALGVLLGFVQILLCMVYPAKQVRSISEAEIDDSDHRVVVQDVDVDFQSNVETS